MPIEDLLLDARSLDDIAAILEGIQQLYGNVPLRQQIFALLDQYVLGNAAAEQPAQPSAKPHPGRGRPGMELWTVLVLVLLKQGMKCDFDHLTELA